jgi:hypothetical protein
MELFFLSSTLAQLPKTINKRVPPGLPSSQRLWLHVLHRLHWYIPLLASRESSIRRPPPSFSGTDGAVQRLRVWYTCLDLLRGGVLAVLA